MPAVNEFVSHLRGAYRAIRNRLELLLIIPIVEIALRAWYHLDARVYFERKRIKAITPGQPAKGGSRFAVFVLFSYPPLPLFTVNALEAFARTELNVILVFNGRLSDEQRSVLLPYCHVLIERENIGRDFGGYKDGISYLRQQNTAIERLVLLNDSVFFMQPGLESLFQSLNDDHDFVGLTEVIEHHYHVQSFMLSFGRSVIQHPKFIRYWRRYRPISTRRWAIHRGEVGLTRLVTKAGFKPHILFHGSQLIPFLRQEGTLGISEILRLMPKVFRQKLTREFGAARRQDNTDPLDAIEGVSRALQGLAVGNKIDDELADIRQQSIRSLSHINTRVASIERSRTEAILNSIISSVTERNQIHVGGFLFIKYLGMPVMKRDIFFRELYGMEDIYDFLVQMKEPLREEIIADLRQKGTAKNFKGFKKVLYRHGVI